MLVAPRWSDLRVLLRAVPGRLEEAGASDYVNSMCMETFIRVSRLAGQGRVLSRNRPFTPEFRT